MELKGLVFQALGPLQVCRLVSETGWAALILRAVCITKALSTGFSRVFVSKG